MSQEYSSESTSDFTQEIEEILPLSREIAKHQEEGIEAKPYAIFIQNLRHPSYKLRHPIPVLIERNDDAISATFHDIDVHGIGGSVQEAISDLCAAIVQYYEKYTQHLSHIIVVDKGKKRPLISHILEIVIIIFLLYDNILMGAFVQPNYSKAQGIIKNIPYIFTWSNFGIAAIGAIIAYVILRIVEDKLG